MSGFSKHIQKTVPLSAGLLCIVLAGLIWMPLTQDGPSALVKTDTTAIQPTRPDTKAILAEGAQELAARPLFHITRRPPVEAAVEPQPAPVAVTLSLTGIVNSDDVQIAIMRLSNQSELVRGQVGDQVGDWKIEDMTETSVTVIAPDGSRQVINLTRGDP
jgi:hypothetical protein